MTLCIGWREDGKLGFAADSRISFSHNSPFDEAIKIVSVRVEVDTINPYTLSDETLFHGNIALCFSGSTVNFFALRESLSDRLTGLLMPNYAFQTIARRAFEQYVHVSKELCYSLAGPKGLSDVYIAGYCNEFRSEKAFSFSSNHLSNEYILKDILSKDGEYIAMGSGKEAADRLFGKLLSDGLKVCQSTVHGVIAEIINSKSDPTVGGRIRTGSFNRMKSFQSWWIRQKSLTSV